MQGENGVLSIQHGLPLPAVPSDRILVKVHYVAINPCDWKMPARFPTPGCVDGCDFAGTVVAVGSQVAKTGLVRVGSRVCGAVHGSNPIEKSTGTFSDYVVADGDLVWLIPPYMGFEEAPVAASGVILDTLGLVFKTSLCLPGTLNNPATGDDSKEVLVYAASTAIGTATTHLLKLFGHKPIAVCSPKNYELVRSYGAVEVFDYHSPTCAADIRAYTRNSLAYIVDPIVEAKTMQLCYAAMGRAGGKYCALEAYSEELCTRKVIKPDLVIGMRCFGRKVALDFGYESEADPHSRALGIEWRDEVQKLLDEGRLKAHPIKALPGRYEGIMKGLEMLRTKQVSGHKLVVQLL